MEEKFNQARFITWAMIAAVIIYGAVAWFISNREGYGAVSEGKMNFLRAVAYTVSIIQIILALSLRKLMLAVSKTPNPTRLLTIQIVIGAFCELIALFGLVLVFISKNFTDYAIFAAIALAVFAWIFPRRKDWPEGQV